MSRNDPHYKNLQYLLMAYSFLLLSWLPRTDSYASFAYLHVDDSFLVWEVVIHSGIYNLQLESVLAAKEVDTCPSVKKIADLLPGDLFGREADSLVDNAMIGCEYDILRMSQLGSKCLLDKPDLQGQFFKCSQRAFAWSDYLFCRSVLPGWFRPVW